MRFSCAIIPAAMAENSVATGLSGKHVYRPFTGRAGEGPIRHGGV